MHLGSVMHFVITSYSIHYTKLYDFVSRFGDQVVLLHSGLSASERFDQWSLAMSGEAKIVIGARSAVFAPLADLGLIVVDEEHDAGLKHRITSYNVCYTKLLRL